VLTHGHFDHVGTVEELASLWDVPVWAHAAEMPYLDGSASYPPPDPGVGGLVAAASPLFPRAPVSLGHRLQTLPEGGDAPPLPGWRWIHTPGHAVGHVSLFRTADRAMIVGDAFITTAQEEAYAVTTQRAEMHGPPRYFTHDWEAAARSVRALAALKPELAVTGHGLPAAGPGLRDALDLLAAHFEQVAVPVGGRYVGHPQRVEDGSAYWPPR
jgi:glyoxylase-like metal-dependent hydrolase (beta-lactamase superfamily II)